MKISRQIGTVSEVLQVFVQDASVSTGAGLANVTTPNYTWFRNDQAAVSTGVASTAGAMGIFSTSAWVQLSSANALGWYQFGPPDAVFLSGRSVGIHLYGFANMVPLPLEIELTKTNNQQYTSSTVFSSTNVVSSDARFAFLDISVSSRVASSDSRLAFLDASVSSRVASSDSRLAFLDVSVSSRVASSDSRLANLSFLDVSVSSRVASSDSRLALLDASVSSRVASSDSRLSGAATSSDARLAFLDVSVSSRVASSDSRLAFLDVSVSSRVASSDSRLVFLTAHVSSRAIAGDAMALTAGERASLAGVILTTTQPETIRSVNGTGSIVQLAYEMLANVTDFGNSGTTRALHSVTSHVGPWATYQYDSTSPSSITRIS